MIYIGLFLALTAHICLALVIFLRWSSQSLVYHVVRGSNLGRSLWSAGTAVWCPTPSAVSAALCPAFQPWLGLQWNPRRWQIFIIQLEYKHTLFTHCFWCELFLYFFFLSIGHPSKLCVHLLSHDSFASGALRKWDWTERPAWGKPIKMLKSLILDKTGPA